MPSGHTSSDKSDPSEGRGGGRLRSYVRPIDRYRGEASTQQANGGPSKAQRGGGPKMSLGKNALLKMYPKPDDLPDAMLQQVEHKRGGQDCTFITKLKEKL